MAVSEIASPESSAVQQAVDSALGVNDSAWLYLLSLPHPVQCNNN